MKVIPYLDRRLMVLEEKIKRLRSKAEQITKVLDGLPKSKFVQNIMLTYATRIIELEQELNQLEEILFDVENEFEDLICKKVEDSDAQKVLCYRYILGEDFISIAQYIGISLNRVFYLHRKYLKVLLD